MKMAVHLETDDSIFPDVFVVVDIPCVPRKGENLFLDDRTEAELEEMAYNVHLMFGGYSRYCYGEKVPFAEARREDFTINDCLLVKNVYYTPGAEDVIHLIYGI